MLPLLFHCKLKSDLDNGAFWVFATDGQTQALSMSFSQETITPQESTKGSLNYIPDHGGGTAYDDFDEDDEDDNIHRDVFKNDMLLYVTVEYLIKKRHNPCEEV